jgi:hypothetical protein
MKIVSYIDGSLAMSKARKVSTRRLRAATRNLLQGSGYSHCGVTVCVWLFPSSEGGVRVSLSMFGDGLAVMV